MGQQLRITVQCRHVPWIVLQRLQQPKMNYWVTIYTYFDVYIHIHIDLYTHRTCPGLWCNDRNNPIWIIELRHVYMFIYVCIYSYVYWCIYIQNMPWIVLQRLQQPNMNPCVTTYIYTFIYTYMYIYISMCIYIYIWIFKIIHIYIYVDIHTYNTCPRSCCNESNSQFW